MADVKIRLTADLDDALREVSGFRKEYAELVRQVAQPLKRLNDFTALESTLEDTQRQARSAREQIRTLGNELASTIRPSRELQQAYRDSISDLRSLERAETVQMSSAFRDAPGVEAGRAGYEEPDIRTAAAPAGAGSKPPGWPE
ncbi:hypothetical protein ACFZOK_04620 [Pseudomonas aeruginosa]